MRASCVRAPCHHTDKWGRVRNVSRPVLEPGVATRSTPCPGLQRRNRDGRFAASSRTCPRSELPATSAVPMRERDRGLQPAEQCHEQDGGVYTAVGKLSPCSQGVAASTPCFVRTRLRWAAFQMALRSLLIPPSVSEDSAGRQVQSIGSSGPWTCGL